MVLARFGQIVIGPPGSGKTTYVTHMADLLRDGEKEAEVDTGRCAL